jgi:hypothetical protein
MGAHTISEEDLKKIEAKGEHEHEHVAAWHHAS